MILKESTWTKITQVVLPGLVLFSALAYMHGPSYVAYFQKKLLAHNLPRESMWGPIKYNVRLKADFVSEFGDECQVYVLTDLEQAKGELSNREELVLVDKWSRIVDRQVTNDVGALRTTHLSPQDGYAMLEVVRTIPENRRQAEIVHYQVTAEQIAMVNTEMRDLTPEWSWSDNHSRKRRGDDSRRWPQWGKHHEFTPEQIEEWNRRRARWEERRREASDVAVAGKEKSQRKERSREDRKDRQEDASEVTRSENKKDMQRSRSVSSDDKRLLDVSRLGGSGDEAAKLIGTPR